MFWMYFRGKTLKHFILDHNAGCKLFNMLQKDSAALQRSPRFTDHNETFNKMSHVHPAA